MAESMSRVMIVDDDRAFVEAVALYLEDHGYRAIKACNGREGLEMLCTGDIDLVIVDVHMPDLDGFTLVREAGTRIKPIPAIVISADDSPQVKERSFVVGACSFLPKPVAPDELLQAISTSLVRHS
jgi:CheY-like chemotaxis protein